uniref:Pentatricopeptide repeat-containing protein At2g44880 family n=1 Tax=Cajanus cajan TaxID=3821 RepID=A0A151SR28_CAJCA|nr:Pentatricopeptide repeat-containing protein At2g44880 family [Cajanus cajan]
MGEWSNAERKCLNLLQRKTNSFPTLLQIHAFILRHSLHHNLNLLATFITTCASSTRPLPLLRHARRLFDLAPTRDTFLCNSILAAHLAAGHFSEPLALFRTLRRGTPPFVPDGYTFTALVKGCSARAALREGHQLHGLVVKNGFCFDLYVATALVDLYVKLGSVGNVVSWTSMVSGYCGNCDVENARLMFDLMPEKNLFTWNAMIGGYCQNKRSHEALELFREMQVAAVEPNEVTVVCVLPAVADLGALDLGGWIHRFVQRRKLDRSVRVATALVDMYAKCGEVAKAKVVFEEMRFGPNEVTLIGVLSACNHCGLVEEGRRWFNSMEGFGIAPQIEHYGCMVDLLGRAGCLDEAEKLIQNMPYDANGIILSSFLSACDVEGVKQMMKKRGTSKEVACSVIEVGGSFREFVAADDLHSHADGIQLTLGQLSKHMKVEIIY